MFNLRHFIQPILPVAAVVLLCITAAPDAQANNGAATASVQKTEVKSTPDQPQDDKPKAKATQKASQKSVLDAEVLERPLSFFKNSFSSDEDDDDDYLSHSNTVIITIKALIASLLSTII